MIKNRLQMLGKTAAAYLVGGIAFIQLAPVFFNTFPPENLFGIAEEILMQWLFVAVALGFPISISITTSFQIIGKKIPTKHQKNR